MNLSRSSFEAKHGGIPSVKPQWIELLSSPKGETLYLLSLFFYIWYEMIKLSMLSYFMPTFINLLRFGSLFLLAIAEYVELHVSAKRLGGSYRGALERVIRENVPEFVYSAALVALSFVSYFTSGVFVLVYTALYIVSARNYTFRPIAKVALCAILSCLALILGACTLGIIKDYIWIQSGGIRVRHGLGFLYATYTSFFLFYSTLLLLYLKRGRLGWGLTAGIVLIDYIVFELTDSRTAFALTLLALVLGWAITVDKASTNRIFDLLAKASPAFFVLIVTVSIALMVLYDPANQIMVSINNVLGHRLSISHATYSDYGISLFGQFVEMHGQGLMADGTRYTAGPVSFIDNSFCQIAVRHGMLPLVLLVSSETVLLHRLARRGQLLECAILMLVAIHSFIDSWYLWICMNVFLLLIGTELLKPRRARDCERV